MNISKHFNNTSSNFNFKDGCKSRRSFILVIHAASFKNFITCLIISLGVITAKAQTETDFRSRSDGIAGAKTRDRRTVDRLSRTR